MTATFTFRGVEAALQAQLVVPKDKLLSFGADTDSEEAKSMLAAMASQRWTGDSASDNLSLSIDLAGSSAAESWSPAAAEAIRLYFQVGPG